MIPFQGLKSPLAIHVHVFQTSLSSKQDDIMGRSLENEKPVRAIHFPGFAGEFSKSELNKEDYCVVRKRRLEDAMPVRANSRGFLNPWKQETTLRIRLEDGERQRF